MESRKEPDFLHLINVKNIAPQSVENAAEKWFRCIFTDWGAAEIQGHLKENVSLPGNAERK